MLLLGRQVPAASTVAMDTTIELAGPMHSRDKALVMIVLKDMGAALDRAEHMVTDEGTTLARTWTAS